ncbi:MAG: NifU family protein [Pseudomonadota bacterium]|nr:NifU family protein [Pseudomonadota bacterium]
MFIQTEAMPDQLRMKFFPGETVLTAGSAEFLNEDTAEQSPLASRLFEIDGVEAVLLYTDFLTVTKNVQFDWQLMKPLILGAIMDHYTSGEPVILNIETPGSDVDLEAALEELFIPREEDSEAVEKIKELMSERVLPAAEQMGGEVIYKGFVKGVIYVKFIGPTENLAGGMTNIFSHYIPEVRAVKDYREAIPKPGLDTPDGRAIIQVLDERINPSIASHGGHISLIDVKDDKAYVRLEGGCQGCGMADVTLKQGVEVEIKNVVPHITAVLDVTDHAGGSNPYYSPGKGGAPAK